MSLGSSALGEAPIGAGADSGATHPQARLAAPSMLGAPALLARQPVFGYAAAPSPLGEPALLARHDGVQARLAAPSMLGAPALLARQPVFGYAAAPSMLGAPALLARQPVFGYAAAPSMLGAPALLARQPVFGYAAAPSPLGAPAALAYHDFTGQLGDAVSLYVMDLITPTGTVRVPISSWQATLQTGASNYVQCVVPACAPWVETINAATEFVVSRRAVLTSGQALEYEMARAPTEQRSFAQGPQRYTCTLAGYSTAFAASLDPPAAFDRTLTGVRSVSSGTALRVRAEIDWLLRPGQRAFAQGVGFVVGYINYYAPSGDAYMDVGEQR